MGACQFWNSNDREHSARHRRGRSTQRLDRTRSSMDAVTQFKRGRFDAEHIGRIAGSRISTFHFGGNFGAVQTVIKSIMPDRPTDL